MGWLKRLTGGGVPVADRLAKLSARGDWAGILSLAAGADLDENSRELVAMAGDRLAELNLQEAEACLRAGDRVRAQEHLELAAGQARSSALLARRAELAVALADGETGSEATAAAHDCSGCGAAGTVNADEADFVSGDLPEEVAWELFLGTLPAPLGERYAAQPPVFRSGVLASRQGNYAAALDMLRQDPADSALRQYELALLYIRKQDLAAGVPLLEELLAHHPDFEPALQLAIDLALQGGWPQDLRPQLQRSIEAGIAVGACHAALARLESGEGNQPLFLRHGLLAVEAGAADANLVVALAGALEQQGELSGAEQLLMLLPAGGCHGGVHPLLGELWLRQGRCLDQALESFKSASRQDPANPRWPLRIGQTYLKRGWSKEGETLLRRLLEHPGLAEDQRIEIDRALSGNSGA